MSPRLSALLLTGALLTVSLLTLSLPTIAQAERVLLKAGRVHTVSGKTFEPGQILIEDGKIVAVAKSIKDAGDATVLDHSDSVVMPGLVNAYSQLGVVGNSSEFTREVTPGFVLRGGVDWRSRDFQVARESGCTTVHLAPGTENVVAGMSMIVKTAGDAPQQRTLVENHGMFFTVASDPASRNSSRRRPDSIYVRQPTNRMGVVWVLRSTLARALDKRDEAEPELLEALSGKRPIYAVSRTSYDLTTLLTLSDEFNFKSVAIGGQEGFKLKEKLAERKVPVILGPMSSRTDGGPERSDPAWNNAGVLHEAGVTIALSGNDLLEQARFAVRFGLPEDVALAAITATPAKLLGVDKRVGSIAKGRDADLVILNGPPLEFTTQVEAVMINGQLYE